VKVVWGLGELPGLLGELGIARPFLVASRRWDGLNLPSAGRWDEIPSHRVEVPEGVDGILAVGGGSAIDTAKAVSAATGLPLVSVPTTYSGAEWTTFFGVRDPDRRFRGGGSGARLAGIAYEPGLTLDLPREETGGTALNALAHCAEALYVRGRNEDADRLALEGARLIGEALPRVLEELRDRDARATLLLGAARAGEALARSGLALGHAMAQALGGGYGLPHGALNAICLPAALRFNEPVAPEAIRRLGEALGTDDPAARVEELARAAGIGRLRDLGVPEDELDELAEDVAARPGARANPRPPSPAEIAELLRSVW
jgi:maleylacetate reductase